MPLTTAILQAAQELGAALRATDIIQSYLEADANFLADPQLAALQAEIQQRRQAIREKETAGQALSPQEINAYHNLLEQLHRNPLYLQREADLKQAQLLLAQTAETISSILSIRYATLVDDADQSSDCS